MPEEKPPPVSELEKIGEESNTAIRKIREMVQDLESVQEHEKRILDE